MNLIFNYNSQINKIIKKKNKKQILPIKPQKLILMVKKFIYINKFLIYFIIKIDNILVIE